MSLRHPDVHRLDVEEARAIVRSVATKRDTTFAVIPILPSEVGTLLALSVFPRGLPEDIREVISNVAKRALTPDPNNVYRLNEDTDNG